MYNHQLHRQVNIILQRNKIDIAGKDNAFYVRAIAGAAAVWDLYSEIYGSHPARDEIFGQLVETIVQAYVNRAETHKGKDEEKSHRGHWFLSNEITGMSLYVDRFCGTLRNLGDKLPYFEQLGVNFLHLMPLFESPADESDGGYAVSDFKKVDQRFGSLADLVSLQQKMHSKDMYLMVDIVLNHTSHRHQWAVKAKAGDKHYQDYFYMLEDKSLMHEYEKSMPEVFPESSPGNFSYVPEIGKWVMTVFHNYQWDLNYTNPAVFLEMLNNVFFYANLGVDILRIDAPAFIWKQIGTSCQNLPQAHTLLRLIKQCVQIAAPGMALLGEAIVAPAEIMKYFGTGPYTAKECDFAYNATYMALQWDMLATGDTAVMLAAQNEIMRKPRGTSWITYTRCHDDIGLAYDDYMIQNAGYDPYRHRRFLQDYYSGSYEGSPATGALFSSNLKTGDARISGSLASLCGLENALAENSAEATALSIRKILLMQAYSFFVGGIPMIFYGDEAGYTNDYSYLDDPGKSYDNRWMHRPVIDWSKHKRIDKKGTVEYHVFSGTRKLISIRKKLPAVADRSNLVWLNTENRHLAGFMRAHNEQPLYGIFNFSSETSRLKKSVLKQGGTQPGRLFDHWSESEISIENDHDYLVIEPYDFFLLELTT